MKKTKKKKFEFSKIVVGLLITVYFYGLCLGSYVITKILMQYPEYSVQALLSLFTYISPVALIGIRQYMIKSEHENIHKFPDVKSPIVEELGNQINDTITNGLTSQGIGYETINNINNELSSQEINDESQNIDNTDIKG